MQPILGILYLAFYGFTVSLIRSGEDSLLCLEQSLLLYVQISSSPFDMMVTCKH